MDEIIQAFFRIFLHTSPHCECGLEAEELSAVRCISSTTTAAYGRLKDDTRKRWGQKNKNQPTKQTNKKPNT